MIQRVELSGFRYSSRSACRMYRWWTVLQLPVRKAGACMRQNEPTDIGRDSSVREELHDIEEVAWVLAVHRCDQLATIHILERHHGNLDIGLERVARFLCQRRHAHGMDRATHDKIHFDLNLDSTLPDEQLGLAGIRRGWRLGLEALLLQARSGWHR